jgi:tryptophan synthase alpha chain
MNRITAKLKGLAEQKRKALALFLTAGYPHLDATVDLILALEEAGADIIEIGLPFSDPLADGPVIQEASAVALRNGVTLARILADVRRLRERSDIPVILMGYLNPILRFGEEEFFASAAKAGADGLVLPEVPLEESARFAPRVHANGLAMIYLVTPASSTERISRIDGQSTGFLYCVSTTGVTGAEGATASDEYLRKVKKAATKNPVLVGFGVHSPDEARRYSSSVDGVIIGSALLKRLNQYPDIDGVCAWVRSVKSAME